MNNPLHSNTTADILVVDDTPENLRLLKDLLTNQGYKVRPASSGEDALETIDQRKPDLILLDIKMPSMDGYEVCRQLKASPDTCDIPIIFITASGDPEGVEKGLKLGAVDYINKPFHKSEVLARMETQLRLQAHAWEMRAQINLLNEYKHAMDVSNIVSKTDPDGIITYVNDAFIKAFGYTGEELIGQNHNVVRDPDTPKSLYRDLWNTILSHKVWRGLITNRSKDGQIVYIDTTIVPIHNERGEIREFIAARDDVTRLVRQEELLHEQTTDSLTGLPNRIKLMQDLKTLTMPQLAMINIDQFKGINDFYGLDYGDMVLLEVGERLRRMDGEAICAYRIGGDLFAVLANDDMAEEMFEELIRETSHKLAAEPLHCDGEDISIRITAGISVGEESSYTHADLALAQAKAERKDYLVYDKAMQDMARYEDNISWTRQLKEALAGGRVIPYYQPIIDNVTGATVKHEALVRMIGEVGEVISPFHFLEVAKCSRQYSALTVAVVNKVVEEGLTTVEGEVSINLTVEDVRDSNTVAFLRERMQIPGVGERMVLEITESEGIENYREVAEFVTEMKGYGCKLAIDDFGTGYSNFAHLLQLKADFIKIDGSIIKNLVHDLDAQLITRLIVDAAHGLGMQTIAEFVSSPEIHEKVIELGIDFSQGYYLGEPAPAQQERVATV